ncbi:MAG: hypothetical protein A2014_11845 [Spirochaetes bacterium GWF1_49_6]|nr:MAG: hypothetical protein A2014_11845 [Spirochaetes bacterium GWF1_49_6]
MKYVALAFGLVLMMTACGSSGSGKKDSNEQIAAYKTSPAVMSTNGVEVSAKLTAIGADGRLKLEVKVKNNSQKKLSVNPAMVSIQADTVNNTPYSFEGGDTGLVPGGESTFVCIYTPINNPFLMQKYNVRGDLKKSYSLELSFIGDDTDKPLLNSKINFEITDQEYTDYLSKYGIEKNFQGYNLAVNPELFVAAQKKYILDNKMNATHEHDEHEANEEHEAETPDFMKDVSVLVSGNEILLDNIMMKIVGYKIKDTVTVFFRIINRKPEMLSIDLKKFILKADGKDYNPANDFLKDNPGIPNSNGIIPLGLNERVELVFEYNLGSSPLLLGWGTDGFFNKDGKKIIHTNLILSNVGLK